MIIYFFFLIILFKTIYNILSNILNSKSIEHKNFFPNMNQDKMMINATPKSCIHIKKYLVDAPLNIQKLSNATMNQDSYIVKLEMRTKSIKNTVCDNIAIAYHNMTVELIKEFHPTTSIVVGNTIILVFTNDNMTQLSNQNPPHFIFKGSHDKLNSVIASFASSILSLKLNKPCSFFSTVIQSNNNMHYILSLYKTAQAKNIIPYFIKRSKENDKNDKNKYVKFTLNRIKLNNNYNKLFNESDSNIKDIKYIAFNKFLDINSL